MKRNESEVQAEVVLIDPEKAKELLDRNIRNRNLDKKTVSRYAEIMRRGEWRENYEPIHISDGGVLLNGQHRLNAIIESGIPQKMMIIKGVKDEAMDSYDRLKVRSTADIMSLHNIPNSSNMSSTIKAYIVLKRGGTLNVKDGMLSSNKPKDLGIYDNDFVEEYSVHGDEFQDLYAKSRNYCKELKGLMTASEMDAYMSYLVIDKKHKEDVVLFFFKKLVDLSEVSSQAIFLLRKKLIDSKLANLKITSKMKKAYIVKAWNSFIQHKDIKMLSYRDSDSGIDFI